MLGQQQFEDLLNLSKTFQKFSVEFKKIILASTGEDRVNYEKVFQDEAKGLEKAVKWLKKNNGTEIDAFKENITNLNKNRLKDTAVYIKQTDEAKSLQLLDKLNEIP